jgi:FkbM family methyltransferase
MFTSYAQNFEDVMLWRALKHVGTGFYVDIGAQDPIVDSVSMGFYEQGWRGLHVEPVAAYAQLLRERRPDEVVIEAAVGAREGRLTLYELQGTGLSTARREIALGHASARFSMREVEVECQNLDRVLAPYAKRDIHWLKIDVEGFERAVLTGWQSAVNPWIVVVESTLPGTQSESHREWEALLLARDYAFAWFDGLNRFYVSPQHPELMQAFSHGPVVFDDFTMSGTATSSYCATVNARAEAWRHQAEAREADLAEAAVQAIQLRQRLEEAQIHGAAAEAHIAAMTQSLSWRITAPLRGLRGLAVAAERTAALHRALGVAKQSSAYAHFAPWIRERYPGLWLRAKRILFDASPPQVMDAGVRRGPRRANVGTSIPLAVDGQSGFDALAEVGSVSAQELAALLEREIIRQRKG